MKFNLTPQGRELIRLAGLTDEAVWSAAHSRGRLLWHFSESQVSVYGVANEERHIGAQYLLIGAEEAEDGVWDITSARTMEPDEIATFKRETGRRQ